jgi:hypothetical protein
MELSLEYAATYKFLDLGYRPTQSHPQIFLLALIVNSLEVFQIIVQPRQLAILVQTIITQRWTVAGTVCWRGLRELKHEEKDEVCRAFAAQFIVRSSNALASW